MFEYFAVSISLVLISSIALSFFLNKRNLLKNSTVKAILISTISVIFLSVFFPFLAGYLMSFTVKLNNSINFGFGVGFSVVLTLMIYFGALLLLSVIVADFVMDNKKPMDINSLRHNIKQRITNITGALLSRIARNKDELGGLEAVGALENQNMDNIFSIESEAREINEVHSEVGNMDHQIQKDPENKTNDKEESDLSINFQGADLQGAVAQNENILQKPVDREQNIDTIGVVIDNRDGINTNETASLDSKAAEAGLDADSIHESSEDLIDDQIYSSNNLADDSIFAEEKISELAELEEVSEEIIEASEEQEDVEEIIEVSEEQEDVEEIIEASEEQEDVEEIIEVSEEQEDVEEIIEASEEQEDAEEIIETSEEQEDVEVSEEQESNEVRVEEETQEIIEDFNKSSDEDFLSDEDTDKAWDISNQSIEELIPEGEKEMEIIDRDNLIDGVQEPDSEAIESNNDMVGYFEANEDYFDDDLDGFTGGAEEINDNAVEDETSIKSVADSKESVQDRFEDINNGNNIDGVFRTDIDKSDNNIDRAFEKESLTALEEINEEELVDEALNEAAVTIEPVAVTDTGDVKVENAFDMELKNDEKPEETVVLTEETVNEDKKVDDNIDMLDEYINEAFGLKASGDYEGAILNYMYALEQKPDDDLVFWLVLDICALYKQLGKVDLAKNILEGYISEYGSVMNKDVKAEIEKNLLNN